MEWNGLRKTKLFSCWGLASRVLVHAFVTSRLDYCNSLLFGIPNYQHDRLQRILSAATCIVCLVPKFSHHTPVLHNLDWLPESYQTQFKILLPVHLVCHTAVFSFVTQLSFPQTAAVNRTTLLFRGSPIRIQLPFSGRCSHYVCGTVTPPITALLLSVPHAWMTQQSKSLRENKQSTRLKLWSRIQNFKQQQQSGSSKCDVEHGSAFKVAG